MRQSSQCAFRIALSAVLEILCSNLYLRWYALGIYNFLKHVDHVVELSMDVTNDDDWLLDSDHVGLIA